MASLLQDIIVYIPVIYRKPWFTLS
jgi:hypothetical protein